MKYLPRLRPATTSALISLLAIFLTAVAWPQDDSAPVAAESDAASELEQFIEEVDDFSARFEETLFDADGELIDSSIGSFSLLRPNRFVWHYETPFELIVVGDGETLWTYDVELENVETRPLAELESTPAMLLSGTGRIDDNYSVSAVEAGSEDPASDTGLRWIELLPLEQNAGFAEVRIAFSDGAPVVLELVDALAQRTTVEFTDGEVNAGIDAAQFAFEPPDGVNVVGN